MALNDVRLRQLKPRDKPYRLYDEGRLYLEVTPAGGKLWRWKYQFAGKEKLLALGKYPAVSLKEARAKRDEARRQLESGVDPSAVRKQEKLKALELAENTFAAVAREWAARHLASKSEKYRAKVVRTLERDVFPYIGKRPVEQLNAPEILTCVRKVEARGRLETAHRALQYVGQVCRYAVATGRAISDPTAALRRALPPVKPRHMAAPTEPGHVGQLLRTLDAFAGGAFVGAAIRLLPLLFVRPGELRTMRWEDVDLDAAEWRYTVGKTKTEHLVPLSPQAVAILQELWPLSGHLPGGWVFPGARSPKRPMSDAAMNAAYRRLGIDTRSELTGHGWRAVARTLLHERLGYKPEVIEHQLAHRVPDTLGRAYNRTRFIDERRKMMNAWADYLDSLRKGADVIRLNARTRSSS
jgi:integrase